MLEITISVKKLAENPWRPGVAGEINSAIKLNQIVLKKIR
jgi:hypothetical protein